MQFAGYTPRIDSWSMLRWLCRTICIWSDSLVKAPWPKVMHTLKSYSAHGLSVAGVETPVWQKGYHDHGLRDDEDYGARVRYVLQNPLRAGLVQRVEDYPYVILPDWWNDP